jgi:hypothetical protein
MAGEAKHEILHKPTGKLLDDLGGLLVRIATQAHTDERREAIIQDHNDVYYELRSRASQGDSEALATMLSAQIAGEQTA